MPREAKLVCGALLLLAIQACESGPSGPGTLMGRVTGAGLGAAVIEVVGDGIGSFDGRGNTRAYAAPVGGPENTYRVILIEPDGEDILFQISVADVGMEGPVMTVVSAAGTDNVEMIVATIVARIER